MLICYVFLWRSRGLWLKTENEIFQTMSKTFGEKGIELVKEAGRSNFNLAPFNEDAVRQVSSLKNSFWKESYYILYQLFQCIVLLTYLIFLQQSNTGKAKQIVWIEYLVDDWGDPGLVGGQQGGGGSNIGNLCKCLSQVKSFDGWDRFEVKEKIGMECCEFYCFRHAGIDRNKRCLLAYLNSRMQK